MALFNLNLNNQTLIIIITSIIWAMNFRLSFNNINAHMDSGSFVSLKFDPFLILLKNISCIIYLVIFFVSSRKNKSNAEQKNVVVKKEIDNYVIYNVEKDKSYESLGEIQAIALYNRLDKPKDKFLFLLKVIISIIFIYISEELYFIISNIHILDRIICPIRNIFILIAMLIFSLILLNEKLDKTQIKNFFIFKRHQVIPLIIIFIFSLFLILYNFFKISRFKHLYGLNMLFYIICFILTGLEFTIIKYLVDKLFINKFLILGIKGILGTIVFTIINIRLSKKNFEEFFDDILSFEYTYEPEEFKVWFKMFYIITLCFLQYLKIEVINRFSEIFLLSTLMITDIIYFPLYCIERFAVQRFKISTFDTFILNSFIGVINLIMMLIFNEILELNFCGLNKHLRKNIINREENESMELITTGNNDNNPEEIEEEECND